ncbi:MAG: hypothetical protein L6R36_008895, partial [Xanthoria steineri]
IAASGPHNSVLAVLNDRKKSNPGDRYNTSKLLLTLFFREFVDRLPSTKNDVIVNLVNPGFCYGSELHRAITGPLGTVFGGVKRAIGRSTEVGARTLVHGAVVAGKKTHGCYLSDEKVAPWMDFVITPKGEQAAHEMWKELSEELSGVINMDGLMEQTGTLTVIHDQMANVSQEAGFTDQENAETISDLMAKLDDAQKENAELKAALSTSDSEKKSLNQHISDLERQIQTMEATQKDLRQSADQAQNDLEGLRRENTDQARAMAPLLVQSQSERSAAAQQLSQTTEAHAAAIKTVRDDLSRAGRDHAVAIENVRAKLASRRESFKLLREENSDFQRDYQQQQIAIETLSQTNSEMEKKANARYDNLNTSYHAIQRDMKVLKQHISRLENLHQSSRLLLRAATRNMVPLDSIDSFFKLQSEFMAQRDALPGDSEPYGRPMPRMMFEPDGFQHAPVIHAINFNFALRTGKISFRDSQALFNAPTISADNCVYPFVLEALDTAVAKIERLTWPVDKITVNAILTVIQGVAYLTYLAKAMQISGTDVETLGNKIQACLAQECQGSVLEAVFNKTKISSSGQPITTWLGHTNSNHQLDNSNSALGPSRCIIGDATAPKNFVLLDQIGGDEVLYTFVEEEVSAIELNPDTRRLVLLLGDNFTSDQVDRPLVLSAPIHLDKHVIKWCSIFVPYKLAQR